MWLRWTMKSNIRPRLHTHYSATEATTSHCFKTYQWLYEIS